jgi:hypothetical protein
LRTWLRAKLLAALTALFGQLPDCVFLRREDAFAALEDALGDEPDWSGLLYVAPIELDVRDGSAN